MNHAAARSMLGALRCASCERAPTADEVTEMAACFGHKLSPGDGPSLVWRCLPCQRRADSAGVS